MTHPVYHAQSISLPLDHHAIFIGVSSEGAPEGIIFQVTGNIQQGMTFETRAERADFYFSEFYIGEVRHEDMERVKEVCESVTSPEKQFEGAKRLYPGKPLRRCSEWTVEAIEELNAA